MSMRLLLRLLELLRIKREAQPFSKHNRITWKP